MIWLWTVWGDKSRRIWNESQLQQPKQAQLWWCLSHARRVFTLYLSVPCWSCLSSLSSTVKCRVMHSIRACRPRYSLYSALKSFLYLWRCSGELITKYFLLGTSRECQRPWWARQAPFPAQSLEELDTYDKYSAASGDEEETPLLLAHVPFKPETSSIRKMARFSVFKEKQTAPAPPQVTSIDHFHTSHSLS